MSLFTLDDTDIKRMEKDLRLYRKRAMPYAARQTLTGVAFRGRQMWQDQIEDKLINRNTWTKRQVRVDMARSLNLNSMSSTLGHTQDYMLTTETGGTESGRSGAHAIPTGASAGQRGKIPRTRMPRPKNRMKNIRLTNDRSKWKSTRQEVFVKVLMAAREGHRHVFLETNEMRGIFRVTGRGRLNRRGQMTGVKMEMIQNLEHRSVKIPAHPTLQPTLDLIPSEVEGIYRDALLQQLRRHRVFGY